MNIKPKNASEWIILFGAMTGLGIIGVLILFIGAIAVLYSAKLAIDIIKYGL